MTGPSDGCTCNYPLSEIECEREARLAAEKYIEQLIYKAQRRQEFIDSVMLRSAKLKEILEAQE